MSRMQVSDSKYAVEASALELPGLDIRAEITKQRAEVIVRADAAGIPRRPLGELVREFQDLDVARFQGR